MYIFCLKFGQKIRILSFLTNSSSFLYHRTEKKENDRKNLNEYTYCNVLNLFWNVYRGFKVFKMNIFSKFGQKK